MTRPLRSRGSPAAQASPNGRSAADDGSRRTGRRQDAAALLPTLALALVAITWGVSFSVVDGAVDALPSADLVAWRFAGATALLALIGRTAPRLPTALRLRSLLLGALLGVGFLLQTWAMPTPTR